MALVDDQLALFHPLIAAWFREQVGTPTDVQAAAWPRIAAGEHVLVTAPTGSGKTLTAFLWAINQLVTAAYPLERCSVLYISPLKALNNDIQRNLLSPLEELRRAFRKAGVEFPSIRVLTRSGDTPAGERRRMQRKPPEILITTPESLNILLSSRGGMAMLGSLQAVILDEVHSVLDGKRGTHLMTAVERLVRLSGEFQRIALSATVRPPELAAAFVGGYQREGDHYTPRRVTAVRSAARKQYRVGVHFPAADEANGPVWDAIVGECKETIARNRSTLIFANTRRLAETLAWRINADEPELIAYAHHGALSREIRAEVEHRLKSGQLKAIVATNSLEMGIDIGALDEVVLIQAPPGVASAIQRVGRAGHRVGEVSRACLFPTHGADLLESAVLARAILDGDIEAVRTPHVPLDVLSQVLISMTGTEVWDIDELFAEVRCSYPYHALTRAQFDLVLEMLAGRYAEARIRELSPRLSIDRLENTVSARPGALHDLYLSGGMIPDRGYFHLRNQQGGGLIGELDEEYVWEAAIGQALSFGTQSWRIERITHNDVFVVPAGGRVRQAPFYKGEVQDRDFHFSAKIGAFLEEANARLDDRDFSTRLAAEYCLDDIAAKELIDYLHRQRESTRTDLPHRHHLLVEHVASGPDGGPGNQIVLHTGWGGAVNRPFAMALSAAWDERYQEPVEIYPADDAIYLQMARDVPGDELLALVNSAQLDGLLRKRLEGSGFFGARFREAAGRALLLVRRRRGERMPLWVSRLRSKKLLQSVMRYPDFPILLEAWRSCLQDEFDLESLRGMLVELEAGAISWSDVRHDIPSPFAQAMGWQQINKYMYADDTPEGRIESRLRGDLLQEVVFTPGLRPAVDPALAARFAAKRQRLAPGYAPASPRELLDWVKERLLLPLPEWRELLAAGERDSGLGEAELLEANAGKLVRILPPGALPIVAAREALPRLRALWPQAAAETVEGAPLPPLVGEDEEALTDILGEWLRFYGPLDESSIASALGIAVERLQPALEDLLDTQMLIRGQLLRDRAGEQVCDSENFEILLRMARAEAAPNFTPLPAEALALFQAQHQGLCKPGESLDDLWERLEQLSSWPARAALWEEAVLPARMLFYDPAWLDSLMGEGRLLWLGAGEKKFAFCTEDDLPLAVRPASPADDLRDLLPDIHARYTLPALAMRTAMRSEELVARLWAGAWAGTVSNDSFAVLRKGIQNDFQPPKLPEMNPDERRHGRRPGGRGGFGRWSGAMPFAGSWYRLPAPEPADDPLEEEERGKERARLLLERYGLLFRELLQWEAPPFQWPAVFRALRIMELSGEVLGGVFFDGIPGLQFISHRAFRQLQRALPTEVVWWCNACDPASLCGLPLEAFRGRLPRRVPGNYIAFRGQEPVLLAQREGKELHFLAPPNDPRLPEYFAPLHHLLGRRFNPIVTLTVESINGEDPGTSPYLPALAASFDVVKDYKRVFVARRR